MKDKIFMLLLGIIAVNLTIQTVRDVGLFPTAYAQAGIQRVAICDIQVTDLSAGRDCARVATGMLYVN